MIKDGVLINSKEYINSMDKNDDIAFDIDMKITSYLFEISIAI